MAFHPIDVHVGSRVKLRRKMLGMSQEKLGNTVSLTFQQIQKYERGANRIGASRVYQFSQALDVPISFFFDDLPASETTIQVPDPRSEEDIIEEEKAKTLVESYYRIRSKRLRFMVRELFRVVAGTKRTRGRKST